VSRVLQDPTNPATFFGYKQETSGLLFSLLILTKMYRIGYTALDRFSYLRYSKSTMKTAKIILIPSWFPEFIKKWIFKDGRDGDVYVRDGEKLSLTRDMKYGNGYIENGGILDTNNYRVWFSKQLTIEGQIANENNNSGGGKI